MVEFNILSPTEFDRGPVQFADVVVFVTSVSRMIDFQRICAEVCGRVLNLGFAIQRGHIIYGWRGKTSFDMVDLFGTAAQSTDAEFLSDVPYCAENLPSLIDGSVKFIADLPRHALAQHLKGSVADS